MTQCKTCNHPHVDYINALRTRYSINRTIEIMEQADSRCRTDPRYEMPSGYSMKRHRQNKHNPFLTRYDEFVFDYFVVQEDPVAIKIREIIMETTLESTTSISVQEATHRIRQNIVLWRQSLEQFQQQYDEATELLEVTDDDRVKAASIKLKLDITRERNRTLKIMSEEARSLLKVTELKSVLIARGGEEPVMGLLGTESLPNLLALQKKFTTGDFQITDSGEG